MLGPTFSNALDHYAIVKKKILNFRMVQCGVVNGPRNFIV